MSLTLIMSVLIGLLIWFGLIAKFDLISSLTGVIVIVSGWLIASRLTEKKTIEPASHLPKRSLLLWKYLFFKIVPSAFLSACKVMRLILSRGQGFAPTIVTVTLSEASARSLFLLSYAVTLSPGQQVIQIEEASGTIYIHVLDAPDPQAFKENIRKHYLTYVKEIAP